MATYNPVVPYADATYADTFFADRMGQNAFWSTLLDSEKEQALKEATLHIDELVFVGEKAVYNQVRQWPRYLGLPSWELSTTPDEVYFACCEQAYYVAYAAKQGIDLEARRDHQDQGILNVSRAGANESWDIRLARTHRLCSAAAANVRKYVVKGACFMKDNDPA